MSKRRYQLGRTKAATRSFAIGEGVRSSRQRLPASDRVLRVRRVCSAERPSQLVDDGSDLGRAAATRGIGGDDRVGDGTRECPGDDDFSRGEGVVDDEARQHRDAEAGSNRLQHRLTVIDHHATHQRERPRRATGNLCLLLLTPSPMKNARVAAFVLPSW